MLTLTPWARTLLGLALALAFAGSAAAYVPADDTLAPQPQVEEDETDAPPFGGEDQGGIPVPGGVEDFAPIDHLIDDEATSVPAPRAGLADIRYGSRELPEEVAATREALLAAARSGDIGALRPIFARQTVPPIVDGFEPSDDAVDTLRLQSGDPEGREILAILSELLESGYVKIGEGSTTTYVWPYFAEVPLGELAPPHYVELYRVLTAVDVEEMVRHGRYMFFRVGIAPDGRIRYFSAGDIE